MRVKPYGIFVNTNNTVHVADGKDGRIWIWFNSSINLTKTISQGLNQTYSVFATAEGDIYADNGYPRQRVEKWTWNANNSVLAMNVSGSCNSLFVDTNNSLYCSLSSSHQVMKKTGNESKVVAGSDSGCPGITSDMLYRPYGIFVHINFSLYVADCGNDRIQLFQPGQRNATTIVGNGAPDTIDLDCPCAIVLDGNEYLYIVDQLNNRIIGSGPSGFGCVAGCSFRSGSAANQLSSPYSMAFDSYGNMFVADQDNYRIQKFTLELHSCGKSDNM